MFENPIKPRGGDKKKVKNVWDFSAPEYDQRTGPSIPAGDYYGTGYKNPVGRMGGKPTENAPTLPKKPKRANADSVIKPLGKW